MSESKLYYLTQDNDDFVICYVVGTFLSTLYVFIAFSHTSSEIGTVIIPL